MEGVPKFLDYTDVMQTFLQIPGVVRVHNLRIWALSINKIALAAHLAVGTYILHDLVHDTYDEAYIYTSGKCHISQLEMMQYRFFPSSSVLHI